MKKVISYSIYGNNPKYTVGLLKNLELRDTIYPEWINYVYYNNTVPQEMIEQYKTINDTELFNMDSYNCPGMLWRLFVKDADIVISRDSDSRLNMREKYAVDEWVESGKLLHIIRDHFHHRIEMFTGMFGMKIDKTYNLEEICIQWCNDNNYHDVFARDIDSIFVKKFLYDKYINNQMCHDSVYQNIFPNSKSFPTKMEDYRFIGEIYDENDNRAWQYKEWINKIEL